MLPEQVDVTCDGFVIPDIGVRATIISDDNDRFDHTVCTVQTVRE